MRYEILYDNKLLNYVLNCLHYTCNDIGILANILDRTKKGDETKGQLNQARGCGAPCSAVFL